jgi:hypothetical protein
MDFLNQLLQGSNIGGENAPVSPADVLIALGVSFVLMMIIATVYQRTHKGEKYSQDYVHMLIMLGLLVSVVIMGIGGNAARAFGIFAAFSIVRFRRSVPEARDLGFIFFAMAIGLAVGGREYSLAVLTTLVVCVVILLISRFDLFAPVRHSHLLRVRVTNEIDHTTAFRDVFDRLLDRAHLLSVESVQAGLMTEVSYAVQIKKDADPLELVSDIQARNGNNRVILRALLPDGEDNDD